MPGTIAVPTASRYLIIAPAWIGDMVMAQSLFRYLKQLNVNNAVDVVAPASTYPLLERMQEVRKSYCLDAGHGGLQWRQRRTLAAQLPGDYDQAIVLPNSFKSALIPWFRGIPRRTGYRGEWRYGLLNDLKLLQVDTLPLMVQRFCALATEDCSISFEACPQPELTAQPRPQLMERLGLDRDGSILGICPGAEYGPAKQWPAEHFAEVASHHARAGGKVWLFGSGQDRPVTQAIIDAMPIALRAGVVDLAGRTRLPEVIDLLACTDQVVSNDSGLMHIAAAVGRPLVVIYGSTSPGFTPPLGARSRVTRLALDCSPCFKRDCPLGHRNCLKQLGPDLVQMQLQDLAAGSGDEESIYRG